MAKKILFTSFKGGTGVTTVAVGVGFALAAAGERTLIVDGDKLTGCAEIMGECRNSVVYTLADYEKGACRAKQTLVSHPRSSNLLFMPSINSKDGEAFKRAVTDVDGLFDYILCDRAAAEICDCALIVTEPFTPSIKSADLCRSRLTDGGLSDVALIVNKLSAASILNGETMTAYEIAALLRLKLAAVIPEDLSLPLGKAKRRTKNAFRFAADGISGKRDSVFNILRGAGGLNGYIKRKMREKL